MGTTELSPIIQVSAEKRLADIRHDLEHAGSYYPRKEVRDAMAYWKIEL